MANHPRPPIVLTSRDYQLAADALTIVPADGWWCRAACLGKDPHWWFNDDEYDKDYRSWMDHQARTLCWACPVRQSCLNYALLHREEHGIWGGYDFEQLRRRLKLLDKERDLWRGHNRDESGTVKMQPTARARAMEAVNRLSRCHPAAVADACVDREQARLLAQTLTSGKRQLDEMVRALKERWA